MVKTRYWLNINPYYVVGNKVERNPNYLENAQIEAGFWYLTEQEAVERVKYWRELDGTFAEVSGA